MSMQEDDLSDILARERAQEYDETPAGERETAIPTKWIWIGVGTLVLIVVVAVIYYLRDKAQNTSNGTQGGSGTQTASGVGGGWYQPTEGNPVDGGSTVPYGVIGNGGSNVGGTPGSGTTASSNPSTDTNPSGTSAGTYTPPAARGAFTYSTASGGAQTLSGIASAYGDTVAQISSANPGLSTTGSLPSGTTVNIPGVHLASPSGGNAAQKVTSVHSGPSGTTLGSPGSGTKSAAPSHSPKKTTTPALHSGTVQVIPAGVRNALLMQRRVG